MSRAAVASGGTDSLADAIPAKRCCLQEAKSGRRQSPFTCCNMPKTKCGRARVCAWNDTLNRLLFSSSTPLILLIIGHSCHWETLLNSLDDPLIQLPRCICIMHHAFFTPQHSKKISLALPHSCIQIAEWEVAGWEHMNLTWATLCLSQQRI